MALSGLRRRRRGEVGEVKRMPEEIILTVVAGLKNASTAARERKKYAQ
jgi:hypothetical protein